MKIYNQVTWQSKAMVRHYKSRVLGIYYFLYWSHFCKVFNSSDSAGEGNYL